MDNKRLDFESAGNICIVSTLEKLGYFPTRRNDREAWFLSPLRSETNASFKVSVTKNLWYDHGMGKGGNVITLIAELRQCSSREAVEYLSGETLPISPPRIPAIKEQEKKIHIKRIRNIRHPVLIKYLMERRIRIAVAKKYCREVLFSLNGKKHFSLGLRNDKGGWELRNKYAKYSSSPKTYTHIRNSNDRLLIIEGMFDFLSLAVIDEELVRSSDVIVLNSLAFTEAVKPLISDYREVLLYLDNDTAGVKAGKDLLKFTNTTDRSSGYSEYKDLNEMIRSSFASSWKEMAMRN